MVLYPDVLSHLLPFLPLQDQMRFTRVCRSWRSVGARAPALKALRNAHVALQVVDALDSASFRAVNRLLKQRLRARKAQARLQPLICEQQARLIEFRCRRVSTAGLLPLLQSIQVQRVKTGADGSLTVFFTVEEPGTGTSCPARILRMSAQCGEEDMGNDIDRTHYRICKRVCYGMKRELDLHARRSERRQKPSKQGKR